jgi:hypothetical protein
MKCRFSTLFLAAALAIYGASAHAQQLLDISPTPDAAEKRAFLAYMFREWDFLKVQKPACAPLLDEMKHGNVIFLDPSAFGETEKPQAVRDLEKQCPNLHLGTDWEGGQGMPNADTVGIGLPVTEQGLTEMFGEPYRATRYFSLFNARFPNLPNPRPIFVAEKSCQGSCSGYTGATYYELIDPKRCEKEKIAAMERFDSEKQILRPGAMFGPAQIGGKPYFINVDRGMIRIEISAMPSDVKPNRGGGQRLWCTYDASHPHR